jgi:hypothetical protein
MGEQNIPLARATGRLCGGGSCYPPTVLGHTIEDPNFPVFSDCRLHAPSVILYFNINFCVLYSEKKFKIEHRVPNMKSALISSRERPV